jgi:nickel/cobalt exporter
LDQIIAIQRWLYGSMASGLGDVAGGQPRAVFLAMAAAILFGAVHALMPGHGKMVLVSYHLGQKITFAQSIANGSILALTHVGLALVLVLAGFAVISRAFAYGGRTPQFETASGVLVALIGAFLLWRSLRGSHAAQTEDSGKTLAFVTGLIPCPLTTFIMSYALARGLLAAGLAVTAAMTHYMILLKYFGSGGGTRTPDTRIMIPPFCSVFCPISAILSKICRVYVAFTRAMPVRPRPVLWRRLPLGTGGHSGHTSS